MKALMNSKNVSIYCSVLHKGKYYEASGSCSLNWELRVDHSLNEVHGIHVDIPNQKVKANLYFLDDNGVEVNDDFEIEVEDAKVNSKQITINTAILPQSIEVYERAVVFLSNDPSQPF
jgi:hypothetical protein